MRQTLSARVVAVLLVGEAFLFFVIADWFAMFYLSHGATWAQTFVAGSGDCEKGGLLLVAAVLYWSSPDVRAWLRIAVILCGPYGVWTLIQGFSIIGSWNPLHGNLVAIGGLTSVGLILISVAALVDFVLEWRHRGR